MILKAIKERRHFKVEGANVRAEATESGERYIEGYAALFNHESKLLTEWRNGDYVQFLETIEPGAFDDVLKSENLNCIHTVDHDRSKMLARTANKSLELSVDDKGLKYRFVVPNTQLGNDTYEMVKRGLYYESSFVFTIDDAGEKWDKKGDSVHRTISKVTGLYDTSTVVDGAYGDTAVKVARNLADVMEIKQEEAAPVLEEVKPQSNELDLLMLQAELLLSA